MVDTNILTYAVNREAVEHQRAVERLREWLEGSMPWAITWGIVYEFLRVTTHPRVFPRPLTARQALAFIEPIVSSELVTVLEATPRHATLLWATVRELGQPTGNLFHDLHTAVLMREHGVTEIMTADTDFKKFPFLTVIDPVHESR